MRRTRTRSALLTGSALTLAVAAGCHLGPAATWLPAVRRLTPRLAGRGHRGRLALTFDDGPSPASTPEFLVALADANVHATFFMVGEYLARHQIIGRAVVAAGHEIAVHGWQHHYLLGQPYQRVYRDLARTAALIAEISGTAPRWFRPPYGVLTGASTRAAIRLGMRPILWTTWGRDWAANATADSILTTIGSRLHGATVLLHDAAPAGTPASRRATLDALPHLINRARALGLKPGPLRDHGIHSGRGQRSGDG